MTSTYEFTETEQARYAYAKKIMAEVKGARRERIEKAEAERKANELKSAADYRKRTRDNKIRAALLEMSKTAETYGMKFDAPPASAGWRFKPERFASFKLHVTAVDGTTEVVQIYTRPDGFEWD